jgi:hypothetical protein
MNITREVILDLLPVYLAGEASPGTCALIEEYLQQDPELARQVRTRAAENLAVITHSSLSPDIELRSLRRTRLLIGWQKWLFGLGIAFTALALSLQFTYENGRFTDFHFLIRDYPGQLGSFALLALICWSGYYVLRRRLQTGKLA